MQMNGLLLNVDFRCSHQDYTGMEFARMTERKIVLLAVSLNVWWDWDSGVEILRMEEFPKFHAESYSSPQHPVAASWQLIWMFRRKMLRILF